MENQLNIPACAPLLQKQFPYRLLRSNPLFCEWISNTGANFTEPFFDDTISRLRSATENQHQFKSIASLEMLPGWAAEAATNRTPTALIFHVSRCGSTLLSQLLALQPQHMVLSEVPFLDALLRLPFNNETLYEADVSTLFGAALQLYINSSLEQPLNVFIKTDSWHLHFYEQLRELYPKVPFILLYRDPWQVLQSQQRRRGMQSVPGMIEPAVFKFTPAQSAVYDLDVYMAQVLHTYFEKMIAIAAADKHSLLINYNEGAAAAAMHKIASVTGIVIDEDYEQIILQRAAYHGKYPGEVFKEEQTSEMAPGFLSPTLALFHQLEEMRLRQDSM